MIITNGPTPTNARATDQFIDENGCTHTIYIDLANNHFDHIEGCTYTGPYGIVPFVELVSYKKQYKNHRQIQSSSSRRTASNISRPACSRVHTMRNNVGMAKQSGGNHGRGRHR